ncbi:MAG: HIT domain-containing protein [Fimbriimonadaceae bacterium]
MADRIWAPWRLPYIEKATPTGGCIFVDLPAQERDRENLILYRGSTAFVMLNAFPYTNGHLMVAPFRHTADLDDLEDDELLEINVLVASAVRWLREAYRPDGFNIGVNLGSAAGAGIPDHVHWHIVPRWNGDTNFMTTIGEVRVMPQSLADSYDRLRPIAERLGTRRPEPMR